MKLVDRKLFDALNEAGLMISRIKRGKNYIQDSNYSTTCKFKKSKRKKYYVEESRKILEFIEKYEKENSNN